MWKMETGVSYSTKPRQKPKWALKPGKAQKIEAAGASQVQGAQKPGLVESLSGNSTAVLQKNYT